MDFGLGSFLGSIIGIGSNIFGAQQSVKAQKLANEANIQINRETNQANKDLAEYAFSQNLAQWERENAYNTPKAQQSRLIEAGLNPNLLNYGSNSGMVAASSPEYKAPTMNPVQIANEKAQLGMYMAQIGALASQATLNSAKADKVKTETQKTEQGIKESEARTAKTVTETEFLRDSYQHRLDIIANSQEAARYKSQIFSEKLRQEGVKTSFDEANKKAIEQYYNNSETGLEEYFKDVLYDTRNIQSYNRQIKEKEVDKIKEQIKILKQSYVNLLADTIIKGQIVAKNNFEIELNKVGLTTSDEVYWRLLYKAGKFVAGYDPTELFNNFGDSVGEALDKFKSLVTPIKEQLK